MKWFINLRTAVKLISAFVIMAIILGVVGLMGLNGLGKINESIKDMSETNIVSIHALGEVNTLYQKNMVEIRDMNIVARTDAENEKFQGRILSRITEIEAKMDVYSQTRLVQLEKEVLQKFTTAFQDYRDTVDVVIALNSTNISAEEFTTFLLSDLKPSGDQLEAVFGELTAINIELAEQASDDANVLYYSSRNTTGGIIIAAFLISIAFGIVISKMIAGPLNRIVTLVGQVAEGDLSETSDINSKDEIGMLAASINDMVLNLRQTIGGILVSAESVSAASEQISASAEQIASGSMNQADAAQTMSELFRELSLAINSVAHSAEQASELSNKTMSIAQDGGMVVRTSIEGMTLVNEQMSRLQEDSNQIGEIIEVIDDIAEQTNLLALNAAIEAARAGDQGRGFAVVADEVRKLAERSSEATKQITKIIKGMQENTVQSVRAVEEGVLTSQKTGEAFENIMTMVSDTAHKVAEIAAASEEQAAQSSEVMGSIESISAATQEAAASSEETASTAQSLAHLAEELNKSVATFTIE